MCTELFKIEKEENDAVKEDAYGIIRNMFRKVKCERNRSQKLQSYMHNTYVFVVTSICWPKYNLIVWL